MYELKNGTFRLVQALWIESMIPNNTKMKILAHALNYNERQLRQDIKAAMDYYDKFAENFKEEIYK